MDSGSRWWSSLPEGWRHASLRWLCRIYAGGTPSKEVPEYWLDGSIPWLNSGSVNAWAIAQPSAFITPAGLANSSARWIPQKSVVIALAGQGATKGTAARLEFPATCNQSMAVLVPGSALDYRYLHFWLASNYSRIRNLAGGDLRDGLNLQHIGDIECPLPSIEEQRRIADFLDAETARIDRLLALTEKSLTLSAEADEATKESVMLTASSDPNTRQVPLGYLTRLITSGSRGWADFVGDSGVPFFRSANLNRDSLNPKLDDLALVALPPESEAEARRTRIQRGDVLVGITGANSGWVSLISEPGLEGGHVSQHVCLVRPEAGRLRSSWLAHCMRSRSSWAALSAAQYGGTKTQLSLSDIRKLKIPVPPLDRQEYFTSAFEATTRQAVLRGRLADRRVRLLVERRQAVVQAAVRGDLDVTTAGGAA